MAMDATVLEARRDIISQAGKQMMNEGKDEFYAKIIEEMIEVQERQRIVFKDTKKLEVMQGPLQELYFNYTSKGKDGDAGIRDMLKSMKILERHHFMLVIRSLARNNQWNQVVEFINQKKPAVTYSFMAEVCVEHGKVPFAVQAIKKITDYDEKIPRLIDIE